MRRGTTEGALRGGSMKEFLTNHTDKAGLVGTIFTVGCCLGLPGFLPLAAAVGLGFMTDMAVVKPLLLALLGLTVLGFIPGFRRHGKIYPLVASLLAALVVYWFMFVSYRPQYIQAAVLVMVASSLLNLFWVIRQRHSCASETEQCG